MPSIEIRKIRTADLFGHTNVVHTIDYAIVTDDGDRINERRVLPIGPDVNPAIPFEDLTENDITKFLTDDWDSEQQSLLEQSRRHAAKAGEDFPLHDVVTSAEWLSNKQRDNNARKAAKSWQRVTQPQTEEMPPQGILQFLKRILTNG